MQSYVLNFKQKFFIRCGFKFRNQVFVAQKNTNERWFAACNERTLEKFKQKLNC